jgi:MarR family transcriptional regulator, transcriptional regulator for hemolysin
MTDVDLMFLFNQAGHALNARLNEALADVGITPRDHCVLTKAMTGEHTQGQLAELAGLDKTTMVVTLDHLEKAGLAERRPSATDRRARIVAVTDDGRRTAEDAQAIVDRVVGDTLGALAEDDRTAFVAALDRLVDGPLASPSHTKALVRRPRRA